MEFENAGKGRCVILQENGDYSLILSLTSKEYIVVYALDKDKGNWINGGYYNYNELEIALNCYNRQIGKIKEEIER